MGSVGVLHFPVIVVGAGPVGFLIATNIAKQGIKVLVLERWGQVDQSPRAASYQPCAQAELLESGTFEDVKKHSIVNDIVTFWFEGERKAFIRKSEGGSIFPSGINCPQPKLAEILQEHLLTKYDAEVRFCQKVTAVQDTGDLVNVTAVDPHTNIESQYTCEWLVGADGAGSAVRKFAKIDFEGFSWSKEDFVATNITGYPFEKYGFTTANMVMHPVHWAVVTVLDSTPIWRIAFGVRAGMTNDEIRAEVDEHYKHIFPDWPGPGYKLVELNKYKPHQRCASTFRKGRICLAGDAAHVSSRHGVPLSSTLTLYRAIIPSVVLD